MTKVLHALRSRFQPRYPVTPPRDSAPRRNALRELERHLSAIALANERLAESTRSLRASADAMVRAAARR